MSELGFALLAPAFGRATSLRRGANWPVRVVYEAVFTDLLADLRQAGFDERDIRKLTVDNPAEAFTVRVRKL